MPVRDQVSGILPLSPLSIRRRSAPHTILKLGLDAEVSTDFMLSRALPNFRGRLVIYLHTSQELDMRPIRSIGTCGTIMHAGVSVF